jgi:hypothetical protein
VGLSSLVPPYKARPEIFAVTSTRKIIPQTASVEAGGEPASDAVAAKTSAT